MRHRIAVGGVLAVAMLVSSVMAADALKSGPQPGDTVRAAFNVNNVFDTNKKHPKSLCYV
jgi:hypothetical protein